MSGWTFDDPEMSDEEELPDVNDTDVTGDDIDQEEVKANLLPYYKTLLMDYLAANVATIPMAEWSNYYAGPNGICKKHEPEIQRKISLYYKKERKDDEKTMKKAGMCPKKKNCSNGVCQLS